MDSIDLFIQSQTSETTKRTYTYCMRKWTEFIGDVSPVDERRVIDFRNHLESTLGSRSAALVFNTVRVYFRFLGGYNPFQSIKSPRRVKNSTPRVPEDQLVNDLVGFCGNLRHRAVIGLCLNGLRSQEVCDLAPSDLTFVQEYQTWVLRVVGKGNKERLVPLGSEAAQAVLEFAQSLPEGRRWLVPHESGNKYNTRQIRYVVEKYSTMAGKEIRPHALRHHFATRLIRAGANVLSVKDLLGHESVATTQVYVTLNMADLISDALKDPRNEIRKGLRIVA